MITAALVFSCTGAVLVPCIAASYWRGRQTEPLLRFLDPRLTPTIDEAFVSYPVEYALRSDDATMLGHFKLASPKVTPAAIVSMAVNRKSRVSARAG